MSKKSPALSRAFCSTSCRRIDVSPCTLGTAYFEIGFAPAMKARSLIEAQGGLLLRTRRQQDFVAVGLPGNIERMSKNPLAEPQPAVVGVSDDVLNHPI